MQAGIAATGRAIFFSTESNPPVDVVSKRPDLYGNTHRVGHDIMADWHSILSMVDIASNLHAFAHNDTGLGGFFFDLDMLEVGNPGDFQFDLDMIRAHFTYWVILKSNLLLSTLLDQLSPAILAIVSNKHALAIHQDSWGKQGRRVASDVPSNRLLGPGPTDAILALARCNASKPAQKWTLDTDTGHLWTTALSNAANGSAIQQRWCVGASSIPWGRPTGLVPCDNPKYKYDPKRECGPPQVCKMAMSWTAAKAQCIGVPAPTSCTCPKLGGMAGEGCDLVLQCRPGETITGITFADWGLPTAVGADPLAPGACEFQSTQNCTSAVHTKTKIEALCVGRNNCTITTHALNQPDPCPGHHKRVAVAATGCSAVQQPPHKPSTTFKSSTGGGTLSYCNELQSAGLIGRDGVRTPFIQNASSGPLPHTRWFGPYGNEEQFFWAGNGTPIISAATHAVIDDSCTGEISTDNRPQDWCMEAMRGGNLEVWLAELSGYRLAVALVNRSPSKSRIVAHWSDLGLITTQAMGVFDVWEAKDMGTHARFYATQVASKGAALLVLSPS